ncbi:MAG: hypothetical protein HY235_07375 [Acidobacteria bacterium]|nr:hypothetical protein [Acidobacteriota bacterium]
MTHPRRRILVRAARSLFLALTVCGLAAPLSAQRQELGLTLGRVLSREQSALGGRLDLGGGIALQANYGFNIIGSRAATLLVETHFLASPLRDVGANLAGATRDFATLYITPGLRVKFAPRGRVSPYLAVGGGYALYEQSAMTISGQPNPAPRHIHRGVVDLGGGVDAVVLRWLGVRLEVRDFYSGKPSLNVSTSGSGLHNIVVGGGFVLRF